MWVMEISSQADDLKLNLNLLRWVQCVSWVQDQTTEVSFCSYQETFWLSVERKQKQQQQQQQW
jgi:hypothetical protein